MTIPANRYHLLFVDDELDVLNAIRRQLASWPRQRSVYCPEFFSDPLAALERAKHQRFSVVVSDYRMPVMDGITFLKALAREQERCVPIVMSGFADMNVLARLINEAAIFRFIGKPWDGGFLRTSIRQGIARYLVSTASERKGRSESPGPWQFSSQERRLTTPQGIDITLTDAEAKLIVALKQSDGKVATRKRLIEALGHDFMTYDERRIEVRISRLRAKIREQSGGLEPIRSEWGTGYLFVPECRLL